MKGQEEKYQTPCFGYERDICHLGSHIGSGKTDEAFMTSSMMLVWENALEREIQSTEEKAAYEWVMNGGPLP